jgi:hypothetical protein
MADRTTPTTACPRPTALDRHPAEWVRRGRTVDHPMGHTGAL